MRPSKPCCTCHCRTQSSVLARSKRLSGRGSSAQRPDNCRQFTGKMSHGRKRPSLQETRSSWQQHPADGTRIQKLEVLKSSWPMSMLSSTQMPVYPPVRPDKRQNHFHAMRLPSQTEISHVHIRSKTTKAGSKKQDFLEHVVWCWLICFLCCLVDFPSLADV